MFTKLTTLKKYSNQIISINDLVSLIKNNPDKDLINYIRSIEYKSKEYNNLKTSLPCILPHGVFNGLKNKDLLKLSNYLYYDIDGFNNENELNDTINKLNDTFPITLICKSVGGKGISFLIKVDTNEDFTDIYNYIRSLLIEEGFNIDNSASGIVRKMIISSDEGLIYNENKSFNIDKVSFDIWTIQKSRSSEKIHTNQKSREERTGVNDTNIIDLKTLLSEINIETVYTKEIDGDFSIDEMDYYRIILPKVIIDGTKNRLYTRIINALFYINPNITNQQVYSYLFHVNKMANPPMDYKKLITLTMNISNNIRETGEVKIKPRIKKIHFSKDKKIEPRVKQSMAAQINGVLRTNKTIDLIEDALMELASKNIEPTQRKVVEITGLSIATVKRNWNKEKRKVSDIEFKIKSETKENLNDIKYDLLEEEFFKNK